MLRSESTQWLLLTMSNPGIIGQFLGTELRYLRILFQWWLQASVRIYKLIYRLHTDSEI